MKNYKGQEMKEAVALKYDDATMSAPTIIANGQGEIAENILAQAKNHQIPIQEDPSLVKLLGKLQINEQIPDELFKVVAEVFAFIYRVDRKVGKDQPD